MPRQSKEQIIAELDDRKIGYSDEMSYAELCELLKQARDADGQDTVVEPEEPIDYSKIRCGLSTIQDLHRRVTILERKLRNA